MLPVTDSVPGADPGRRCSPPTSRHLAAPAGATPPTAGGHAGSSAALARPGDWAAEPLARAPVGEPVTAAADHFLMLHGHLQPGYDYLLARKLSSLWREMDGSPARRRTWRVSCDAASRARGSLERHAGRDRVPGRRPSAHPDRRPPRPAHPRRTSTSSRQHVDREAAHRAKAGATTGWRSARPPGAVPPGDPGHAPPAGPQRPASLDEPDGRDHPRQSAAGFVAYLERKTATCTAQDRDRHGDPAGALRPLPRRGTTPVVIAR